MEEQLTRRLALGTFGAAGLAGISACGGKTERETPANLAGKELAKVADVPVGGGKINRDYKVYVVQPTAGVFKAFTTVCTHRGCQVLAPADGRVSCPCHGSEFDAYTGKVTRSPASAPLREYQVKVENGAVIAV